MFELWSLGCVMIPVPASSFMNTKRQHAYTQTMQQGLGLVHDQACPMVCSRKCPNYYLMWMPAVIVKNSNFMDTVS